MSPTLTYGATLVPKTLKRVFFLLRVLRARDSKLTVSDIFTTVSGSATSHRPTCDASPAVGEVDVVEV